MPKDILRENVATGNIVYQWMVKEYEQYERTRRWYVVTVGIGALLIAYALYSSNYLFALIIVLFGIVMFLHEMQAPLVVPFAITETGIILGKKYYRYSELANFWLIYNPPDVKNLYFTLNNVIKHRLQIPLLDYDPRPIREFLAQYLEEDLEQEDEPLSDQLARLMQLH